MPTLAVIVLAVVALLLLAMLLAGGRKAAQARARISPDDQPYRSHAEASRHSSDGT